MISDTKCTSVRKISQKLIWKLIILFYALILFILNFVRIFDNDFWGDEGFTIRLAQMSIGDMIKATAADVHPPLFYLLEIIGYRIFGSHGWVYHGVALVPYALVLIFSMTVIRKEFGKISAIFMITLSSVLGNAVTYNVEARMYSWAALFVLLSYYELYCILIKNQISSYILFTLASLSAAYTHYYALISVAFFYVALLIYVLAKKLHPIPVLLTCGVTIVSYLPWLFKLLNSFKRVSNNYWMANIPTVRDSLLFFFETTRKTQWYSILMLGITFFAVIIGILYNTRIKSLKFQITYHWLIWGIIAAVGTLAIGEILSELIRPLFLQRYLYPISIVLWLVFSVAISKLKYYRRIIAVLLCIITLTVCLPQYVDTYKTDKELDNRCRDTVNYLNNEISADDMILTNNIHLQWTILDYYLPDIPYTYISAPDFNNFNPLTQYWMIWSNDIGDAEKKWLSSNGYQATEMYHAGILGTNEVHVYKLSSIR